MIQIKNESYRRRFIAGALIVVSALLMFKAGKEALSNFYAQSAHMEVERWSAPDYKLRGDEGARVAQYLANSLDYSADNPWSLEELASLELRGLSAVRDPQLALAAAQSANTNYRLALVQRPTSPFTWANFALTKLYLGEQDDELFRALARAEEFGPWQPEVQQTVVFVGLTVWNRLSPEQQHAVTLAMQRGAQRNALKIAEIVRAFNRIDLFCALRYIAPQGREICTSPVSKPGKTAQTKTMKGQIP